MLTYASDLADRLEHFWEERVMNHMAGTILVIVYLAMIVVIEFNRQGWLPMSLAENLPHTHFYAVEVAFTLLLFTEVVSLIFALTTSFSRSIGIQLEILALIFLRDTFKKFTGFGEPLQWELVSQDLSTMIADAAGALLIFVILGIYYRQLRDRPITKDDVETKSFIAYKKLIALGLIIIFVVIGILDFFLYAGGGQTYPFFETFYTVLIFTDVLMVLLSLRYSTRFAVTFRNFSFAVVTVFIRIALIAPLPLNVGIGILTAFFALGMVVAYNRFADDIGFRFRAPDNIQTTQEVEAASSTNQAQ